MNFAGSSARKRTISSDKRTISSDRSWTQNELTDEQIAEYADAFNLFDKDGDGRVAFADLGVLMHSVLGQRPTDQELKNMVREVDYDEPYRIMDCTWLWDVTMLTRLWHRRTRPVTLDTFLLIMSRRQRQTDSKRDLLQAFQVAFADLGVLMHSVLGQRPTDQELKNMVREVDYDEPYRIMDCTWLWDVTMLTRLWHRRTRPVTLDTFLLIMSRRQRQTDSKRDLLQAFQMFDKDKDGYISAIELRSVMMHLDEKLTDDELRAVIAEADLDGDGRVDYNEFVKMMTTD